MGVTRRAATRECFVGGRQADLRDKIQKIAPENRFYGYRRVCQDLLRIHGIKVNPKHVLRLMREDNLLCLRQKLFVP